MITYEIIYLPINIILYMGVVVGQLEIIYILIVSNRATSNKKGKPFTQETSKICSKLYNYTE